MNQTQFNSMQDFGYNRFDRNHSVIGSYNMGIAYPLGYFDIPIGGTIENDLDIFCRSSPLADPSFLDCDISVGHYFVSYDAMDAFYRIRCQQAKGGPFGLTVELPVMELSDWSADLIYKYFGPGSLADHLGLGLDPADGSIEKPDETLTVELPLYPFIAYHMIVDRFFRNSRIQDVERTRKEITKVLTSMANVYYSIPASVGAGDYRDKRWILALDYLNYLPDYLTTTRPSAGGPDVRIPTPDAGDYKGTIHELLDAMLLQKIGDMLDRGGYSYNDFVRVIYNVDPGEDLSEYPVFLAGGSSPLQVSTVVNQTSPDASTQADPLGTLAGNVSSYLNGGNSFIRRVTKAGIYMPMMWIRPKAYYPSGVGPQWRIRNLGEMLIPQLADMSDAPVLLQELQCTPKGLSELSSVAVEDSIWGYKDRYQEYRTCLDRVVGEMRTSRKGWYVSMPVDRMKYTGDGQATIGVGEGSFLMNRVDYSPWVVTDRDVDHFFARVHHSFRCTFPLPVTSRPYVW